MAVGVRTSYAAVQGRSDGATEKPRPSADVALVGRCWAASSVSVRMITAGAVCLALVAALDPAIPFASTAAIAVLIPAALIDVHVRRLPDVWVGAAAAVFLVAIGLSVGVGPGAAHGAGMAVGAMVMSVPLLILHLASPTSMGFGDVKAALVLGSALGAVDLQLPLAALAIAAGATATYGVMRSAHHIAFGPGLVGASLVALVAHDLLVGA
jgi:leader peptidase (prepilin peptidase) / N-methyltransferase